MDGLPIGLMLQLGDFGDLDDLRRLVLRVEGSLDALVLEEENDSKLDPVVTLAHLAQLRDFAAFGLVMRPDSGRPPSVMAKLLSGLDLTTDGRSFIAIGYLDDATSQEYDRTEDALELISEMVAHDATTYLGTYFAVNDAWNTPRRSILIPGFAKTAHAVSLKEVLHRSSTGWVLPSALVVEISDATLDDHNALAALFRDGPDDASRVGVITVGPTVEDLVLPGDEVRSLFDALLYRFEQLPNERQLHAFAKLKSSS